MEARSDVNLILDAANNQTPPQPQNRRPGDEDGSEDEVAPVIPINTEIDAGRQQSSFLNFFLINHRL